MYWIFSHGLAFALYISCHQPYAICLQQSLRTVRVSCSSVPFHFNVKRLTQLQHQQTFEPLEYIHRIYSIHCGTESLTIFYCIENDLWSSKIELHQYFNLKSINLFNTPLLYNMKKGRIKQIMMRGWRRGVYIHKCCLTIDLFICPIKVSSTQKESI